jgi:hypothetical protein
MRWLVSMVTLHDIARAVSREASANEVNRPCTAICQAIAACSRCCCALGGGAVGDDGPERPQPPRPSGERMMGENKPANCGAELGSGGAAMGEGGGASGSTGAAALAGAVTAAATVALAMPRGFRGAGARLIGTGAGEAANGCRLAKLTVMVRARTEGPTDEADEALRFASR